MKKLSSYRNRIFAFGIVFFLVVEIFVSAVIISGIFKSIVVEEKNIFTSQKKCIEDTFDYYNNYISSFQERAKQNGVADYVSGYLNMRVTNPDIREEMKKRADSFFDLDNSYERFFDEVYFFAPNSKCLSYIISDNMNNGYDKLLNVDTLSKYGVYDFLVGHDSVIKRFRGESIKEKKTASVLTEDEKKAVKSFVNFLDGKLIYYDLEGNIAGLYVLNETFFEYLFLSDLDKNIGVVIKDESDNIILQSREDTEYEKSNNLYLKTFNGSRNKIEIFKYTDIRNSLIFVFIFVIFLFSALINFIMMRYMSSQIVEPYNELNNIFKAHSEADIFKEIDYGGIHTSSSIMKKIYTTIVYAIVLPVVFSVILYILCSNFGNSAINSRSIMVTQKQMAVEIIKILDVAAEQPNNITNEEFSEIAYYSTLPDDRGAILNEKVFSDFKGEYHNIVLFDDKMRPIYDMSKFLTSYSTENRKSLLNKIEKIQTDSFVLATGFEVNDKQSFIIGRKVKKDNNEISGYICVFVSENVFGTLNFDFRYRYVLFDRNDTLFESSYEVKNKISENEKEAVLKSLSRDYEMCNINLYSDELGGFVAGEKSLINYEYHATLFITLLFVMILLALVIMLAWWFSLRFTDTIKQIVYDINHNRNGIEYSVPGFGTNEIVDVVSAYNYMITTLNRLNKEKIELQNKEKKLEILKTKAELETLQHQINPHFLYNTLEMLNLDAIKNKNMQMSETIISLVKIFRYALNKSDDNTYLSNEIENARSYAKIQKGRLGDRIDFEWSIDEEALSCEVPRLILQPLVENAIIHGAESDIVFCRIKITAYIEDNVLVLRVANTKNEFSQQKIDEINHFIRTGESLSPHNYGVALKNVYKRIRMYYGGKSDLNVSFENKIFCTEMTIDFDELM